MATSAASKYGARLRDTNLDSRGGATPQNLLEKFVQKLLITLFSEGAGGDSCPPAVAGPGPPCIYKHLRFHSFFLTHFIILLSLLSKPDLFLISPIQTQTRARRSSEQLKEVVEVLLVVERETVVGGADRRLEGEELSAAGAPGLGRGLLDGAARC